MLQLWHAWVYYLSFYVEVGTYLLYNTDVGLAKSLLYGVKYSIAQFADRNC